ncbi:hypothetical protein G7Y89_g10997 [Cudoniella acicularis]|uniref:Uncharacterized protein n=1 Tax=Cudoniella acicularis TaxID=354080 RepID=A0A8H4VYP3_9HELO|nr:hypothetical protein G7Y89_g10997 [Cudoniella acicularis]
MGRQTPRYDPLGSRASASRYYRVAAFEFTKGREVHPADFDEDVSELEEEEDEKAECDECDGDDSDCECRREDDESERSYDGSDAGYYYELKEDRQKRKRALLEKQNEQLERAALEKAKKD